VRALLLPFQLTSLLFVAVNGLLLSMFGSLGHSLHPLSILVTYLLLSWLNKYAFALLDEAANGRSEAPVASVEMLGPFTDARVWVHPALAGGVWLLTTLVSPVQGVAVLAVVALLWPLSLAALAISPRMIDTLNPLVLWQVLRGLGGMYLLLVLATVGTGLAIGLLLNGQGWVLPRHLAMELLLLCFYAVVGGALHHRRNALGFDPHQSPEREANRLEQDRLQRRQSMLDEAYTAGTVRDLPRAAAVISRWLADVDATCLARDAEAIVVQAAHWPDERAACAVLRAVISHGLRVKQGALALRAAETALQRVPGFTPSTAAETLALAEFAQQTGRPRLAQALRENAGPRP
jgi:hypothetical protein